MASVGVPVVCVRVVLVSVGDLLVVVFVLVPGAGRDGVVVVVLVVFIVGVPMVVRHRLVRVLVLVPLSEV